MKQKYLSSEINNNVINQVENYIIECENNYRNQIKNIVENVKNNSKIKFVLLAGPSSSGKTTTSFLIKKYLQDEGIGSRVLSLDDFFVARKETPLWEDGSLNFESINAIDWKLFDECVENLLEGKEVVLPRYNFFTGERELSDTKVSLNNEIIIIEGLHALNKIIDNFIPLENSYKVYISVDSSVVCQNNITLSARDIRLIRRSIRDAYTRGTSVAQTFLTWPRVNKGEDMYIAPFKNSANYFINSFHPYELGIYRGILKQLNTDVTHLEEMLHDFTITRKELVPEISLLREFVY